MSFSRCAGNQSVVLPTQQILLSDGVRSELLAPRREERESQPGVARGKGG